MKIRVGNKQNSFLNGEWCKHFRNRRVTSGLRRAYLKRDMNERLREITEFNIRRN